MLWFPSERGLTPALVDLVKASAKNIHIIMPDWHESYFLPTDRNSLSNIPAKDIDDLIRFYSKQYPQLYLMGHSRTAELILNSTHRLQSQGNIKFGGIVLISPHLQKEVPAIGSKVSYMNTALHSNLPIYIFQPQRSTRFVPVQSLVKALQTGGSEVYLHPLLNVGGGYQMRGKNHWQGDDKKAREEFPQQLEKALSVLAITDSAPAIKFTEKGKTPYKALNTDLRKVNLPSPPLALKDLAGEMHTLADYKGKIVIVSFWASWCRPCLEEIPSLVALKEKYQGQLEILAANILEDKETIDKFTKSMKINFPILQAKDAQEIEAWKVYVYPSNFILDKKNKLRYAVTGAIDWQTDEVSNILADM